MTLDDATTQFIMSIEQIMRENENIPSIPFNSSRIKFEFVELVNLLTQFPKTKSYSLEEIMIALDDITFAVIKSSSIVLNKAFEILDLFDLLPGIFIKSLGVLDLVSDFEAKMISSKKVDQMACNGIMAIEKPSILMNHFYKYNSCPFCKEAVRVENMMFFVLDENLKAGITLTTLKQGDKGAFHKKT